MRVCACARMRISIHALREEGDSALIGGNFHRKNFNPRPPRGGRLLHLFIQPSRPLFQSTPSARRATAFVALVIVCPTFQSTPSARRATYDPSNRKQNTRISIHALREEGDACQHQWHCAKAYFNPRPPRGGRPRLTLPWFRGYNISIHALREEGDGRANQPQRFRQNFNPRPPRGGRRKDTDEQTFGYQISIHALREEGDGLSSIR